MQTVTKLSRAYETTFTQHDLEDMVSQYMSDNLDDPDSSELLDVNTIKCRFEKSSLIVTWSIID